MSDEQSKTRPRVGPALVGGLCVACSGLFVFLLGMSTLAYDELLRYGARWVFRFNEPWWGWIHLVLGAVMVIAGVAAMLAARPAIVAALALAVGSTALMVIWSQFYFLWTMPAIVLGVIAIVALVIAEPTLRRDQADHH